MNSSNGSRERGSSGAQDWDRRAHRRANLDVCAHHFLDGSPYLCRATDISPEGVRLLPLGAPAGAEPRARFLGLQFQLPGCGDVLTASGEVVYGDTHALGVRFTRVPAATAAAIGGYLARR